MKILGYVVIALAIVSSLKVSAQTCAQLFNTIDPITQTEQSKLYGAYIQIASRLSHENFQPLNHTQSSDFLSLPKVNFIKRYQSSIQSLIAKGEVSLEEIVKAQVFLAQSININEGIARPHSYVFILNSKIYSFDLKSRGYKVLGENKVGFTQASLSEFLRLGKLISILVQNENVFIFPRENKDPSYFEEIAKAGKIPLHLKELYASHKKEIIEILTQTTATIGSLAVGSPQKVTTENGEAVTFLTTKILQADGSAATTILYFAPKGQVLEQNNRKRWGNLRFSPHMGYGLNAEIKLKSEDGTVMVIENGMLQLSNQAKAKNLLLSMNSVVENSETSTFRSDFIKKHGEVVRGLIAKNAFNEADFNQVLVGLDMIVNKRGEKFYILPSKNGDLYFSIESSQMGRLIDISISEHGRDFYTASGEKVVIGRSFGFLSKPESKRFTSDDFSITKAAFFAKIEVALKLNSLDQAQKDSLGDAKKKVYDKQNELGPLMNLPPQKLVEIAAEIKTDLINNGKFAPSQSDQIIKVLF